MLFLPKRQDIFWRRSCRATVQDLDSFCFFSSWWSKGLIRFNAERQHGACKAEISEGSLKEAKTAVLYCTEGSWGLCRDVAKTMWQTSDRARKEPPQVTQRTSEAAHHLVSPSWLKGLSESSPPKEGHSCSYGQLLTALFTEGKIKFFFILGHCGNREGEKDNEIIDFDLFFFLILSALKCL